VAHKVVRGVEIDPYPKLYVWGIDPLDMQTKLLWNENISIGATETYEFNWASHFSALNRKALDQVDSKGNALIYRVGIKQSNGDSTSQSAIDTDINTASNGYVTARAVKAWHRARLKMLSREGIGLKQLSPYSRQLRFPLTDSDSYSGELNSGEWTNTAIAVEAPQDGDSTTAVESDDLVDTYTLTLTGDHVAESAEAGETQYTSVGIIEAWLNARRRTAGTSVDGSDEVSINHETNPLYNLMSGSMASEEVLEIVQDSQKEEPPYSPTSTVHSGLVAQGRLYSSQHQSDYTIVNCPAGLMQAVITDQNPIASGSADAKVRWEVELLDVYPMKA
jgi:hypothetical protein